MFQIKNKNVKTFTVIDRERERERERQNMYKNSIFETLTPLSQSNNI